jgi:hypothetical protein
MAAVDVSADAIAGFLGGSSRTFGHGRFAWLHAHATNIAIAVHTPPRIPNRVRSSG